MSMQDAPAQAVLDAPVTPVTLPAPEAAPLAVSLNRQVILDATAAALADVGYDGTTIRKIASLLNCAVGSIYRYFTDKRQILLAVAQRRLEGAAGIVESGGSFEQSVRAYVDAAVNELETYQLMFWPSAVGPRDAAAMLPPTVAAIVDGWGRRLGDANLAQKAWSVLHGSIVLGQSREQVIAATLGVLAGSSRSAGATHATPQLAVKSNVAAAMLQAPVRVSPFAEVTDDEPAMAAASISGEGDDPCML